jgi:hypothetical protein
MVECRSVGGARARVTRGRPMPDSGPILASTRKRKIARARLAASGAVILIWVMRRPGDAKASRGR